jgi:dethiobiotin synthetase
VKNQSNILFITGTDTNVGKTVVTSLLVNYLLKAGVDVSVVKPIETGCRTFDGELVGADEELLRLAMGEDSEDSLIAFTKFETPVAPQVAEELEGKPIDLSFIRNQISEASYQTKLLIVEGAGGLLVPISGGYSYADLIADSQMSTLLVVGSRLGALNHAALTMEVLSTRNLPTVGYVLNDLFSQEAENQEARFTNRKMLSEIAKRYSQEELAFLPKLSRDLESYLIEDSWSEELSSIAELGEKIRNHFAL